MIAEIQTCHFCLKCTLRHASLRSGWDVSLEWLVGNFCIDSVSVVLCSDSSIFNFNFSPFKFIAFHEFKEWLIPIHGSHFQLVLVPIFRKTAFDVALTHIERMPVCLRTVRANEDTESNIEHSALGIKAVNAIRIEGISCDKILYHFVLLFTLSLECRRRRRRRLRHLCWRWLHRLLLINLLYRSYWYLLLRRLWHWLWFLLWYSRCYWSWLRVRGVWLCKLRVLRLFDWLNGLIWGLYWWLRLSHHFLLLLLRRSYVLWCSL